MYKFQELNLGTAPCALSTLTKDGLSPFDLLDPKVYFRLLSLHSFPIGNCIVNNVDEAQLNQRGRNIYFLSDRQKGGHFELPCPKDIIGTQNIDSFASLSAEVICTTLFFFIVTTLSSCYLVIAEFIILYCLVLKTPWAPAKAIFIMTTFLKQRYTLFVSAHGTYII